MLAKIPASLLSKKEARNLNLNGEYYIALIPKDLLKDQGITNENIDLDLISYNERILLGTTKRDSKTSSFVNGGTK
ncbi:MAG: hypothetical protein GWN01_11970 [Nitrosopumilaceae archaeon]|nr:hypothetical protein [Nitrosopumilaceae archaeon]NIU01593.1 hypothetical protein [Nitrosopumilaceae archaeon]NIU88012.1 hypothetical protein [Nitrosopumilaceae archaeon]NIV66279.1 hypothetical protein [Nitrosopumilaceae archaeon]NIX62195.1 hypothetical protein [Nitrosopumilaceae archaeon]